jgi:hypothetical protein
VRPFYEAGCTYDVYIDAGQRISCWHRGSNPGPSDVMMEHGSIGSSKTRNQTDSKTKK